MTVELPDDFASACQWADSYRALGLAVIPAAGREKIPVGKWREFQSGIDDMVREAELDELRKAAKQVSDFSLEKEVKKTIDPDGSLEKSFQETTKIDDPFAEPQPVMEPPAEEKAAEATTAAEVPADVAAAPVPAKDETKS